jgi:hypothetical protein
MFNWFKKKAPNGPDFSGVDSLAKAESLFRQGKLERLYLLPVEFGGTEIAANIVYVPVGIASIKEGTDNNIVAPLAAEGKITKYSASPEYQGKSFIPTAINITASDPGNFSSKICIWGKTLEK